MSELRYRPDIDGLRSVAVVPVVLFHLGASVVSGGFIGVDVFFVISGFLITSIIRRELEAGDFSILRFYERRIRRILPALFVVLAATIAMTTFLFVPEDLLNASQSAVAATVFASNILFFLEAGYFDAASYTKPLLHTWSLAIEEQFYILVPLMMIVLTRGRQRIGLWIAAITALSFLLSAFTTERFPTGAYYLLPWRAWELGIGSLLAFDLFPRFTTRPARETAAGLGLALILGALFLIDETTAFPGVAALAPTLGAALIIQAGRHGPNFVGALLSTWLPVWIGKLSYSFYLWHWPIIVGFVYWTLDMPDLLEGTVLFFVSLGISALSLRFVERPFRRPPQKGLTPSMFWGAGVAATFVLAVSGALVVTKGLPGRLPPDMQQIAKFGQDRDPRTGKCFWAKSADGSWLDPCLYGATDTGQPPRVALWGDSYAPALIPALDLAGQEEGISVALYAHEGCPGFTDFQVYWAGNDFDCAPYLDDTIPAILDSPDIDMVIFYMRSSMYTHGWLDYGIAERGRHAITIGSRSQALPPEAFEARAALFLERFEQMIVKLQEAGKTVVLVYPTPEAAERVPNALMRTLLRGGEAGDLILPRKLFDARNADVVAGFDRLAAKYRLSTVRLDQMLCDDTACRLEIDGEPVFRDYNHFNATTARKLSPLFAPLLAQLSKDGDT